MAKKNKVLRRIEDRIAPFSEFWFEWIHSPECYLSKREVDAILLYQHYQDFATVGRLMGLKPGGVYGILNKSMSRLLHQSCMAQYREWIGDRLLEESGAYDELTPLVRFLSTPLRAFTLPPVLKNALFWIGETMGEILERYGEKDLLRLNNFGPTKLEYLKKFLKQNNALNLLKVTVKDKERERYYR